MSATAVAELTQQQKWAYKMASLDVVK